jgi:ABC-type spermidine/putrescine transport system permease subunit II
VSSTFGYVDELALALFLTREDPTLPVDTYGQLRFASRLPKMIALAVLVMLGSLTLALAADRLWIRWL